MKLFGTDGIRGRFGSEPISPQTILKLGWSIGTVFRDQGTANGQFLIGKDTRISGYIMESALASGLLSAGVNISLMGPVPTPAVSYFCRETDAAAGIVISASHNPAHDNGVKLLGASGGKLTSKVEQLIEAQMLQPIEIGRSPLLGKASRIGKVVERYAQHLCSSVETRLSGLKIALDCANGASYRVAPAVMQRLGIDAHIVANQPDGYNINQECGSTSPELIRRETLQFEADAGIALDGDGDRVVMVDEHGALVDGDQLLYVIAMARRREGRLGGGVVGTQISNIGLEYAFTQHNIPFERAKVGDRFIADRLVQRNWTLGGETCGHILNGETGVSGDGLAAALEVLCEMRKTGLKLSQLVAGIKLVPQVTVNVKLQNRTAPMVNLDLSHWPRVRQALAVAEMLLNNHGRVLLRASGTEPMIRILVEGDDTQKIDQIAHTIADAVRVDCAD